jgi:hypothetical protein
MKLLLPVIIATLIQFSVVAQPTHREIMDRKVLSVEATAFNRAGTKMNVQKNYYAKNGADSIEINNGELQFTYKQELDSKGRIKNLSRLDQQDRLDEYHEYAYNDDHYTIEIIAQGAGTISFSTYNLNHDLVKVVLSSTDTLYFTYNESGHLKKVVQQESGTATEITTMEFSENGFPKALRSSAGIPQLTRFVYNEQGLLVEVKRFKIENAEEKLILRTTYSYEFYPN